MTKLIRCRKVAPQMRCSFIAKGDDILEVLQNAAIHARSHGIRPTPRLVKRVHRLIEEI